MHKLQDTIYKGLTEFSTMFLRSVRTFKFTQKPIGRFVN